MNDATDTEISIRKSISATDSTLTFTYRISSPQPTVSRLRLIEQLPVPVEPTAITFGESEDGSWECETGQRIVCTVDYPPQRSVETSFQVASEAVDPSECVSQVVTNNRSPNTEPNQPKQDVQSPSVTKQQ